MNDLVSIVVSTRKIDKNFKEHLKKHFTHPKTEFLFYENDGDFSLTEVYNKGLEESTHNIVVFMHDDIILGTKNIGNKIDRMFEKNPDFGIIGIAGTTDMVNGRWWEIRESGIGRVSHTKDGKTWESVYSKNSYPDYPKEVVCIDGLFMIVHKERIKEKFDEKIKGFHLYDIDFCLANYLKGVKVGVTTKFKITHKSIGEVNPQWEENKKQIEEKYKDVLPIRLTNNKTFDEKLQFDVSQIGVGMVTYDAPDRLSQSVVTIPDWIENFVIVNDGTPYDESVYPEHAYVITHEVNKGVGKAKNTALRYLLEKGCEHIFLIEDDVLIKDENVFKEYINTSVRTGIKHLNYALQGPANKKQGTDEPNPLNTINYPDGTKLDLYRNCVGAFSYYHRSVLDNIGLFDEHYNNAWEHVDHTMEAFKNGYTTPYWYFADIHQSFRFITDIENCIEDSRIRKDEVWSSNIKNGAVYFKTKHKYLPTQVPLIDPKNVNAVLNTLYSLR